MDLPALYSIKTPLATTSIWGPNFHCCRTRAASQLVPANMAGITLDYLSIALDNCRDHLQYHQQQLEDRGDQEHLPHCQRGRKTIKWTPEGTGVDLYCTGLEDKCRPLKADEVPSLHHRDYTAAQHCVMVWLIKECSYAWAHHTVGRLDGGGLQVENSKV